MTPHSPDRAAGRSPRGSVLWLAMVAALACAPVARAGIFSDDEARAQINILRTQLDDASRRVDTVTRNQVDFANQVEALKADIAKLRGQLDELNYNLDTAQKRQKDFYIDLDNRLRKIESERQAQQNEAESKAQAAKAAEASALNDYESALGSLKAGDCKAAVHGFENFITAMPQSPQQPNAYFFAAYCYGQLKYPAKAAEMYRRLIEGWPENEHIPDAMLARADSLEDLGQKKEARAQLTTLAARFPASDAGKQAKARLKKK